MNYVYVWTFHQDGKQRCHSFVVRDSLTHFLALDWPNATDANPCHSHKFHLCWLKSFIIVPMLVIMIHEDTWTAVVWTCLEFHQSHSLADGQKSSQSHIFLVSTNIINNQHNASSQFTSFVLFNERQGRTRQVQHILQAPLWMTIFILSIIWSMVLNMWWCCPSLVEALQAVGEFNFRSGKHQHLAHSAHRLSATAWNR